MSHNNVHLLFRKALEYHQGGKLILAQDFYRQILRQDPNHFDSCHLLGVTLIQTGNLREGAEEILRALQINPNSAEAYYNLAHARRSLGELQEARSCLKKATAIKPNDAEYHLEIGNAQSELRQLLEALASYDRAIHLKPGYAEAHCNRGIVLKELERYDEALASYARAINLKPDYAEAFSNRGNALKELNRIDEAVASHEQALLLKPDYAEAYSNRGNALYKLDRLDEALASYDKAISLKPDYAEAYSNRGNALNKLGRLDEALVSYDRAISLKPDYAEAYSNRGNGLKDLNRLSEALDSYDKAISLKPDFPAAKYSKSSLLLQQGSLLEGFELQLSRWNTDDFDYSTPSTTVPLWDGRPMDGKVLLWAEQGIGDEVFYASMMSLLDTEKQKISVSADKRLHSIYARSFPDLELTDRRLTKAAIPTGFSAQAPIGNIGQLLKVDQDGLKERRYPYLEADLLRKSQLRQSYYPGNKTRVCGIAWKSGNKKLGPPRTIDVADLSPLWACQGIRFVNLQYGDVGEDIAFVKERFGRQIDVIPEVDVYNDIDGLLALIDMCDVVFTIDNVTAHLAGAVGKKGVVLVPLGPGRHWYWGAESSSCWYPSLNVVYQEQVGDWTAAIADASAVLNDLL